MSPTVNVTCSFEMKAHTKEEAITQLVDAIADNGYLFNKDILLEDVLERESLLSTYIGHGIGIPHSQSAGVQQSCIGIGKLESPVLWNDEGEVSDLIFLIAVTKENEDNQHLKILSKLARLLMHEDFRNELRVQNEQQVYELIKTKIGEGD